jgi:hypothetical protein
MPPERTVPGRVELTGAALRDPSSLSDLTANSLILLSWYYFLEAKLLSLFKEPIAKLGWRGELLGFEG